MKKILIMAALAAMFAGCTATKIEYEKKADGGAKYSLWHNGHWLKTEAEELSGSMTKDGDFSVGASGLKSSPSEEFNKTMKTYTAAIVSMMQIAAAAYNPSSSAAAQGATSTQGASSTAITVNAAQTEAKKEEPTPEQAKPTETQTATATNAEACEGGDCTDKACTDGSCEVKPTENGHSLQSI